MLSQRWNSVATNPDPSHVGELSQLEIQILNEKAKGLSDLEVARELFLYESTVRSIVRKHMLRHNNGKAEPSPS